MPDPNVTTIARKNGHGGASMSYPVFRRQPWMEEAVCVNEDPDEFFSRDGEQRAARERREMRAKAICTGYCPVRAKCLDHALAVPEREGIWGGLNEEERATLIRKRKRAQEPARRPA